MWLKFGVTPDGELVNIEDAVRGKTHLTCLYCGCGLTAKKGNVKEHHFAHTEETCRPVTQRIKLKAFPSLPLYDNFNIQLKGEELERLKVLWREYGKDGRSISRDLIEFGWVLKGLMQIESDRSYHFTPLGRIPVGALPLAQFNQVQEPLLLEELAKLERSVNMAQSAGLSTLSEKLADLKIYRAQYRRILLHSLYFLEVRSEGNIFHKIGITTRPIEQRIAEVQCDMKAHYSDVVVNLLGLWEHRGNVELYFKHRYKRFNFRIGTLTEYFQFPKIKPILRDLHGMEAKALSEIEREILSSN